MHCALESSMFLILVVPCTGVEAYLPAFLIVGEVTVSREPSCAELLPRVGVLIGL